MSDTPDRPAREHPLWDRPLEFAAGMMMAIAGLVIGITTVALGRTSFAPTYLSEWNVWLVLGYAALALAGGICVVVGLTMAYRGQSIFGRGVEAAGHLVMAGVALTYAWDLGFGGFASSKNTLLLAILLARSAGSLLRFTRLVRTNRVVIEQVQQQASGGCRNARRG